MLIELRVRNLGVIEDLTLRFGEGMTALTGETGAGKTLLVGALELVLGGRAATGLVREGAEEALVEAAFLGHTEDSQEREIILARSVPRSGRSRAWIDGRMVPMTALSEAGAELVDIHGQREHQSLVAPSAQRRALDVFAGTDLGPLAGARRRLQDIGARLTALGGDEQQRAREIDILRYQVSEIAAAAVVDDDEDSRLAVEEERLADLGAHREAAAAALSALDAADAESASALSALGAALTALEGRTTFAQWRGRIAAVHTEIEDVASDLRSMAESWEDDPAGLDAIQERRRILTDLRRKYGASLEMVREFAETAGKRLDELESADGLAQTLNAERLDVLAAVESAEAVVRAQRQAAAPGLAVAVESRLADLAMPGARLEIAVAEVGAGEPVRFLLGANEGEPLQPLARVASGGELARAMLALRLVAMGGPATMVFDEVDAGVGGEAALALARALQEVAGGRQVLVVTHLAQVAAFAHHQVAVRKAVQGGRTVTEAGPLDGSDRPVELSRMLSGQPASKTARAHAEELLSLGQASTSTTDVAPVD